MVEPTVRGVLVSGLRGNSDSASVLRSFARLSGLLASYVHRRLEKKIFSGPSAVCSLFVGRNCSVVLVQSVHRPFENYPP